MLRKALLVVALVATSITASDDLKKAIELSRSGDHEASEAILAKLTPKDRTPEYHFYRMINNFCLNKRAEAEKYASNLEHDFSGAKIPYRYRDMAIIIRGETSTWKKDKKDLGDIARDMNKISNRLANQKGGKETQKMQDDVLKRIDTLIKDLEDQKDKKDKDKDKDKDGGGGGSEKERRAGKDGKGGKGPMPAMDTINPIEQGTGQVDPKKVKEIAAVWGKLPEKERAKALVGLTKGMPPKDRAIIERYLKELQKRSLDKKP